MMVPFGSLTILTACLIIGRFCIVATTVLYPRFHACVEIPASASCWCIFHENNNNRNITAATISSTLLRSIFDTENDDELRNCTSIVNSIRLTQKGNEKKCSFDIPIPVKSKVKTTKKPKRINNLTKSLTSSMTLTDCFECLDDDDEPHFLTEGEEIICIAPDNERGNLLPPSLQCCFGVSSTDSPNISPLTTTLSIASSPIQSMTSVSSVLPNSSSSSSSSSSEQASVTVTTAATAETTSTYGSSGKETSTGTASSAEKTSETQLPNAGLVAGSVIGVLLIIVIAVVLIVLIFRRYKRGDQMSIDNIGTTTGERNPAYSLVQGNFSTAAHDSTHHHQSTNIYSEAPHSQNPLTPTNSNDTVLVDNELYGHQPNANAAVDNNQQQSSSVYCLVQRTSTSDASPQPQPQSLHPTPSSQKPSSTDGNDTILVENDLYGCQQAPSSTYEMALRVDEDESVGKAQKTSPSSRYSLVRRVSTADDPSQPQATTDTCSAESTSAQKPPAEDSSDRLLVDNDLYNC